MPEGNGTTLSSNSEYNGDTAKDVIRGWNDRRKSNNQIISGLIPFVQLIGLFNDNEYEKLFLTDSLSKRKITFTDAGGRDIPINTPYTTPVDEDEVNLAQWIKEKLTDRFINIYMVDYIDTGLSVAPMDGVVMATTEGKTQVQDTTGAIGITDLQVDYGKSNAMGSRKFVIRMTVSDPTYLNTHPEYAKLAGMGGEYLIIYGWANPKSIPGYSAAIAPPLLEQDPTDPNRNMMVVPMRNLGNGGYWSAGRVHINSYDFSFNQMGQLEIAITLRKMQFENRPKSYVSEFLSSKEFNDFQDILMRIYLSPTVSKSDEAMVIYTNLMIMGANGIKHLMPKSFHPVLDRDLIPLQKLCHSIAEYSKKMGKKGEMAYQGLTDLDFSLYDGL